MIAVNAGDRNGHPTSVSNMHRFVFRFFHRSVYICQAIKKTLTPVRFSVKKTCSHKINSKKKFLNIRSKTDRHKMISVVQQEK